MCIRGDFEMTMEETQYKRLHMRMSYELYDWYVKESKKLDVPVSALMIMAMNEYRKQQATMAGLPDMMKMMELMKEPQLKQIAEQIVLLTDETS